MAFDSLQEFQQLHPTHCKIPRIAWPVHWHPPPPGLVKVNFDGAFFSRENIVGLGIIIQNDQGLVMAALSDSRDSRSVSRMSSSPFCSRVAL